MDNSNRTPGPLFYKYLAEKERRLGDESLGGESREQHPVNFLDIFISDISHQQCIHAKYLFWPR